jgi:hypothetical protein
MAASLAAIIPTRNRAELAMSAVRSLKDQGVEIDIYVSDNSSSAEPLRAFCEAEGVTWLRPAAELAMPEHWDWALRQALERSPATHFTIHYDRKYSKPGHWDRVAAVAAARPEKLIVFPVDHIVHIPPPLRLWQPTWTGKLFRIDTARAAALVAGGRVEETGHALPVLSNCLVPRAIFGRIAETFGNICNSTGPDSAFMSRFLALEDSYLFTDRTTGIVYGADRSNGLGYMTGKGGDFPDFLKTFGERPWLDAAPLAGINLGQNMLYHEYELVRRVVGNRLPPLDRQGVLAELAQSLRWISGRRQKAALIERLKREGYDGPPPSPFPRQGWRSFLHQLEWRRRIRRGETPPNLSGFAFRSNAAALKAGLRFPRRPDPSDAHLALLGAVELADSPA